MDMPRLMLKKIEKSEGMCFGCGEHNAHGLKLKFVREGESVKADFVPDACYQGWPGFVHGGILMTAMDEAIGWVTVLDNLYTVTAKIEVRLKSMAQVGEKLVISAVITKQTKRTVEVEARITRPDGSIVAEASSLQFIVKSE